MIAKDWLEDIKERFVKYQTDYNLNGEDVEWLIQQAERVEELEKVIGDLDENVAAFETLWLEEKRKNKRYKQALENITISPIPLEIDDAVSIARQALEGME